MDPCRLRFGAVLIALGLCAVAAVAYGSVTVGASGIGTTVDHNGAAAGTSGGASGAVSVPGPNGKRQRDAPTSMEDFDSLPWDNNDVNGISEVRVGTSVTFGDHLGERFDSHERGNKAIGTFGPGENVSQDPHFEVTMGGGENVCAASRELGREGLSVQKPEVPNPGGDGRCRKRAATRLYCCFYPISLCVEQCHSPSLAEYNCSSSHL